MPNITDNNALKRISIGQPKFRLLLGESYSTGQHFSGVSTQNEKQLYLENPTSDTYYIITSLAVRSSAKVLTNKAFNVTEDTQGVDANTGVQNKRSGSPNDSSAIARIGGDNETGAYSGGRVLNTKTGGAAGGAAQLQPGVNSESGVANVIDPGEDMCVFATNDTGNSEDMSIDIDWIEITEEEYPS
jgi:hypothetical protein